VRGLTRLYESTPELRPSIKNKVAEMSATGNYDKNANVPALEKELESMDRRFQERGQ